MNNNARTPSNVSAVPRYYPWLEGHPNQVCLDDWESFCTPAGAHSDANTLKLSMPEWRQGLSPWAFEGVCDDDREGMDFWCRTIFTLPVSSDVSKVYLDFDGIATFAEVWLNGTSILNSDNMFIAHRLDISQLLQPENEILMCCRALQPILNVRRPRAPWRTTFANHKNTAWVRVTLLGRVPTWSPPPAVIGPCAPVRVTALPFDWLQDIQIRSLLEGDRGKVLVNIRLDKPLPPDVQAIALSVERHCVQFDLTARPALDSLEAELMIDEPALWWPHTHGEPHLYDVKLVVTKRNVQGETANETLPLPALGFRQLHWRDLNEAMQEQAVPDLNFGLDVNGQSIFCRGACWTPLNSVQSSSWEDLRDALVLLRDAGVNMLRVSGTFLYEQERFYALCDELGLLVWQDFMFARLAYPFDDSTFFASVQSECTQVIRRLSHHPCMALFCGNTEIAQQAAMLGVAEHDAGHIFFRETLKQWCQEWGNGIDYWYSSPGGGDFPFSITQGVSHYFGVGGYKRPLEDARVNTPQFASECLAFSNVPEDRGLQPFLPGQGAYPTHPLFKSGVARDVSSGWDFADITDHYLEDLLDVEARTLRHQDPKRYFDLCKLTTGEVAKHVYGYWRSPHSGCNGALMWWLKDLQMGAGWGLIDAEGYPKALYYYLKRIWSSSCLWFVDNGLEGLALYCNTEKTSFTDCVLTLRRFNGAGKCIDSQTLPINLQANQTQCWNVEKLLGTFTDITYAYQFGPEAVCVTHAEIHRSEVDSETREIGTKTETATKAAPVSQSLVEAFYYPIKLGITQATLEPELTCVKKDLDSGVVELQVSSKKFARAVMLNLYPGLAPDNYFDLYPGQTKTFLVQTEKPLRGTVSAMNSTSVITL